MREFGMGAFGTPEGEDQRIRNSRIREVGIRGFGNAEFENTGILNAGIQNLRIREPSLEDVFIHFTGKSLRGDTDPMGFIRSQISKRMRSL